LGEEMFAKYLLMAFALAIIPLLIVMLSCFPPHLHESRNIAMAIEFNDHSAAAWIALSKDWFKDVGINVSKLITFRTGLELAAAMARGDIPIAWACLGPIIVLKSKGVPIKVLSMAHLHGYAIVARPHIRMAKDLNGKVVATPGPGSPCWLLLKIVEEQYNLSLNIKKIPPYEALNMLLSRQVDAAAIPEHYVSLAESQGMKVLIRSQNIWPKMPGSVIAVREEFLRSHPDIVKNIIKITLKSINYINSEFNESVSIVASKLGIPRDVMYKSMKNLNYTWSIDIEEVQRYIDLLAKYGAIDKSFSANEILDLTLLNEILEMKEDE